MSRQARRFTFSISCGKLSHLLPLTDSLADHHSQHPPVTIELPHPVTSASLHPFLRDRFVAGSANDPWVRVYDLDSGKEKEVYKGHHGPVLCASYSPDGEVYASGSEDGESPTFSPWSSHWSNGSRYDPSMADKSRQELWFMADIRIN